MSTNNTFSDPGKIDFMKLAPIMGVISAVLVVVSIALISTKGFKFGIDFSGGTEIQAQFDGAPDIGLIRSTLESVDVKGATVQSFGEANEVLIRMKQPEAKTTQEANQKNQELISLVTRTLKEKMQLPEDGIRRVDSVGPQVGSELKLQAILAILYSLIVILGYVGLRFDFRFAPGAVLCLFHDTILTLGLFSLLGREVNIQVMAAVLTIIGYSLNDTIVNYDRIRTNEPLFKGKGLPFVINRSVNDMLSRTTLTSTTTLISSLCLYFLGSGVIQDLAFTFTIGVVVGTYSSIYVASPLVVLTDKILKRVS